MPNNFHLICSMTDGTINSKKQGGQKRTNRSHKQNDCDELKVDHIFIASFIFTKQVYLINFPEENENFIH